MVVGDEDGLGRSEIGVGCARGRFSRLMLYEFVTSNYWTPAPLSFPPPATSAVACRALPVYSVVASSITRPQNHTTFEKESINTSKSLEGLWKHHRIKSWDMIMHRYVHTWQ